MNERKRHIEWSDPGSVEDELRKREDTYVVCGEMDVEEKDPTLVRAVRRSHDRRRPMEEVVAHRACAAICGGITLEILQLFVDSFQGHSVVGRRLLWLG